MPQKVKQQRDNKAAGKAVPPDPSISAEMMQADALHSLGENAAALMHELRNPLQAIRAHIQLLERKTGGHNEELKRHFLPLYHSLDHINSLLDQFLRLSRFAPTCLASLAITECVSELLPLLRSMAVMRQVKLKEAIALDLPACLGDEQQLKRLLFNLFANALDACAGKQKARVCITLKQQQEKIILAVQDNGCGMESDKLEAIWQPFYTNKATGTGLGLPACLKIAAEHNGSLTVISRPNEGSCFTLSLPIKRPEARG